MQGKIQHLLTVDLEHGLTEGYGFRELQGMCAADPNGVPEWICDLLSTTPEIFRKATDRERDILLALVQRITRERDVVEYVKRRLLPQVEDRCSVETAPLFEAAEVLLGTIEGRSK